MIHYSCDRCHRIIRAAQDLRYSVQIEIQSTLDPLSHDLDEDGDHLGQLQDILDELDDEMYESASQADYQRRQYDLCPECFLKFSKNPLAIEQASNLEFSDN